MRTFWKAAIGVVLCAVMVATAIPMTMNAEAVEFLPYEGPSIMELDQGNSLKQLFCNAYVDRECTISITAKWLMENAFDANQQYYTGHLINSVSRWDAKSQSWKTYAWGMPPSQNFVIGAYQSYMIHCSAVTGYTFPYYVLYTHTLCPTQASAGPFEANKYTSVGILRNGWPGPMPYHPADPLYVQTYASDYWNMLRNLDGTAYTGSGSLLCWNAQTQIWAQYIPSLPPSDFVVNWFFEWDDIYMWGGLGNYQQGYTNGLFFYTTQAAIIPSYDTMWPAWA